MSSSSPWSRVRRDRPCPVCGKPDWCLIAADGSAAICSRTESHKRCGDAGWLHRLRDNDWQPSQRRLHTVSLATRRENIFGGLAAKYQDAVRREHLHELASSLSLTVDSLLALGIGWASEYRAWSFPMLDAEDNVIGIRLRASDHRKFAVSGTRDGLFVPAGPSMLNARLLICEGTTDTAAIWDLGITSVVGRPNCQGGMKALVAYAQRHRPGEIVIVADGDEAGVRGARNLESVLAVYVPAVRVIVPPLGIKDVREWIAAGARLADIEAAIATAPRRQLKLEARRHDERR